MESAQNTLTESLEPTFQTSIGPVSVIVRSRNAFAVQQIEGYPIVNLELERRGDDWELESDPPLYLVESARKLPVPAALVDEFLKLGRTWAKSHPEEFERAGDEEFDHLIGYIVNDSFDAVLEKMEEAEEDLAEALKNSEFMLQASAVLRNRLEDAAKMLHVMGLQIEAAAEAITTAATAYTGRPIIRAEVEEEV
jgi:hypothetical protein